MATDTSDYYSEPEYSDGDLNDFGFDDSFYESKTETVTEDPDEDLIAIPFNYTPAAIKTIMRELKAVQNEKSFQVEPIQNNIAQWKVKIKNIADDSLLYKDMCMQGINHILIHITFPVDYPFSPPFIRVINPRFAMHTGHVTIGGAICTHLLSNDGWQATYRISNVIEEIRANFVTGNGRLDKRNTTNYTITEAMEALKRLLATHHWNHWATKDDKILH